MTFVGRREELALLRSTLEEVASGCGKGVMLAGEPGVGKTRLAQELAHSAAQPHFRVLWGRCYDREGAPPYWVWIQPLRAYLTERGSGDVLSLIGARASSRLADVLPELEEYLPELPSRRIAPSELARFRLFDSITRLFLGMSREQPLLLILEDLHWADTPSLRLLEFMAHELAKSRILVLGSYRREELSSGHPLSDSLGVLARFDFRSITLEGLGSEDVGQLIAASLEIRPPEPLVKAVHDHTNGNPFFVIEIARLLAQEESPAEENLTLGIPDNVRSVIVRRLGRLSELANRVLIAASALGEDFDFRMLSHLVDVVSDDDLWDVIDEALGAGILQEGSRKGRYQFRHSLMRRACYEELSSNRRARLHARIGETLERLYAEESEERAAELAHHFELGRTISGSDKLVKYCFLAGNRSLATHAYEEARVYFEQALAASRDQGRDAEVASIRLGLGRAQAATALRWNRQEAWNQLRSALEYYIDARDLPGVLAAATEPSIQPEGVREVSAILRRALDLAPAGSCEQGYLLPRYGAAMYFERGDYPSAQDAFGRALDIARRAGDVALELRTLAWATSVDHFHIRWDLVLSRSLRVIELAHHVKDPHSESYAQYRSAYALLYSGRLEDAKPVALENLSKAQKLRDQGLLEDALYVNAALAQLTGDWQKARGLSNRGLEISPHNLPLLHLRVLLEYETGSFAQGAGFLERLLDATHRAGPYPLKDVFAAIVFPQIARFTGDDTGFDTAELAAKSVFRRQRGIRTAVTTTRIGRALMAIHRNHRSLAKEHITHLEPWKGLVLAPLLVMDRLCGLLSHTVGQLDRAAGHFEDALSFSRRSGFLPELAWSCFDYARLLLVRDRRGDRARATALLEEALRIARQLGMTPLAGQIDRYQERFRAKLRRNPDDLTDRELEILRLLAAGKTNKEIATDLFISVNTVAVHVAHIRAKTQSSNRTEAASYAIRHNLA